MIQEELAAARKLSQTVCDASLPCINDAARCLCSLKILLLEFIVAFYTRKQQ